jgi:hypothetical protein
VTANLFKCFLPQCWIFCTLHGVTGLLHQEGVYDDPNAGKFRREIYPRLRYHFQFVNVKPLFPDVMLWKKYSINIYSQKLESPEFYSISNLYQVSTIQESELHSGNGPVPGLKNQENKWETKGHKERQILINLERLSFFANLYDEDGTPPIEARLPSLHVQSLADILKKFECQSTRLSDLSKDYFASEMWNETISQKNGTIRRNVEFPRSDKELILSGPHFYVGNSLSKTPRRNCKIGSDYDVLDLSILPDNYLPRTNYIPGCDFREYQNRIPKLPWDKQSSVTNFYRAISRTMLSQSGERTLISSIVPPKVAHIDLGFEIFPKNNLSVVDLVSSYISLPFDFFVKTTGKGHFRNDIAQQLPLLKRDLRMQSRGLNHRFGHSGRTACLISKVSSMRDRALRRLVQANYPADGQRWPKR